MEEPRFFDAIGSWVHGVFSDPAPQVAGAPIEVRYSLNQTDFIVAPINGLPTAETLHDLCYR